MVKLREAGLLLAQIGKRLGITRQRVQKALSLSGKLRIVPIRCRECNRSEPAWQSVGKLIRVLGVEWLGC